MTLLHMLIKYFKIKSTYKYISRILYLSKYYMSLDLRHLPSPSSIFRKIPVQNMFNFVCDIR